MRSILSIAIAATLALASSAHPTPRSVGGVEHNCLASAIMSGDDFRSLRKRNNAAPTLPWSYEGSAGPAFWGSLNPNYTSCSSGKRQSPINFTPNEKISVDAPFELWYPQSFDEVEVENLGATVEVAVPADTAFLKRDNVKYSLVQFHVHTPSETSPHHPRPTLQHHVQDKHYPSEVHFVHRNPANPADLHVVGLFLNRGTPYAEGLTGWLDEWINNVPARKGEHTKVKDFPIGGAAKVLLSSGPFWQYEGSLTTPPCSEGVRWVVANKPLPVDETMLAAVDSLVPFSSRFTQKNQVA
ncbi:carbonic anhydrase [Gonapodya prolifera JEL478]|uniref:carbonic anhydrase n=1 Tax=Gonapodya prolifera (strain JEL478) TaxID=1344416 RepID=A0A139A0T0_GONPJ|nr:carbonic anhydrase [Gonapodya prolifera JEL478]|eukprot:KXS09963.1 carbonic anhydrase [Gonapodya prolifera JEL478]